MPVIELGCEQLSPFELNQLEQKIEEAECGRDLIYLRERKDVRLSAREARMLFDSATGKRFLEVIANLRADLSEAACDARGLYDEARGLEAKLYDAQKALKVAQGGTGCPAGERCSMRVQAGAAKGAMP